MKMPENPMFHDVSCSATIFRCVDLAPQDGELQPPAQDPKSLPRTGNAQWKHHLKLIMKPM